MRAPAAGPQATSCVACHISFERGDFDFPPLKWPWDLPFLRSCASVRAAMAIFRYLRNEPPGEGLRASLYLEPWVSESSSGEGIGDGTR